MIIFRPGDAQFLTPSWKHPLEHELNRCSVTNVSHYIQMKLRVEHHFIQPAGRSGVHRGSFFSSLVELAMPCIQFNVVSCVGYKLITNECHIFQNPKKKCSWGLADRSQLNLVKTRKQKYWDKCAEPLSFSWQSSQLSVIQRPDHNL